MIRWSLVLLVLLFPAAIFPADPPTAGSLPQPGDSPSSPTAEKLTFEQASQELSAVFPIRLLDHAQVVQHSYNWRGKDDASLMCDIGFTPHAIVIKGEFRDDRPFYQTMEHPAQPDWWKIRYGADGIQFIIDSPTSAALRLDLALNFGSAATKPRVEVLQAPQNRFKGFLPNADFTVQRGKKPDADKPAAAGAPAGATDQHPPILFQAAIPFEGLAEPGVFSGGLRITARLHDMDGDPATYLMMQEIIEKK